MCQCLANWLLPMHANKTEKDEDAFGFERLLSVTHFSVQAERYFFVSWKECSLGFV